MNSENTRNICLTNVEIENPVKDNTPYSTQKGDETSTPRLPSSFTFISNPAKLAKAKQTTETMTDMNLKPKDMKRSRESQTEIPAISLKNLRETYLDDSQDGFDNIRKNPIILEKSFKTTATMTDISSKPKDKKRSNKCQTEISASFFLRETNFNNVDLFDYRKHEDNEAEHRLTRTGGKINNGKLEKQNNHKDNDMSDEMNAPKPIKENGVRQIKIVKVKSESSVKKSKGLRRKVTRRVSADVGMMGKMYRITVGSPSTFYPGELNDKFGKINQREQRMTADILD